MRCGFAWSDRARCAITRCWTKKKKAGLWFRTCRFRLRCCVVDCVAYFIPHHVYLPATDSDAYVVRYTAFATYRTTLLRFRFDFHRLRYSLDFNCFIIPRVAPKQRYTVIPLRVLARSLWCAVRNACAVLTEAVRALLFNSNLGYAPLTVAKKTLSLRYAVAAHAVTADSDSGISSLLLNCAGMMRSVYCAFCACARGLAYRINGYTLLRFARRLVLRAPLSGYRGRSWCFIPPFAFPDCGFFVDIYAPPPAFCVCFAFPDSDIYQRHIVYAFTIRWLGG